MIFWVIRITVSRVITSKESSNNEYFFFFSRKNFHVSLLPVNWEFDRARSLIRIEIGNEFNEILMGIGGQMLHRLFLAIFYSFSTRLTSSAFITPDILERGYLAGIMYVCMYTDNVEGGWKNGGCEHLTQAAGCWCRSRWGSRERLPPRPIEIATRTSFLLSHPFAALRRLIFRVFATRDNETCH